MTLLEKDFSGEGSYDTQNSQSVTTRSLLAYALIYIFGLKTSNLEASHGTA